MRVCGYGVGMAKAATIMLSLWLAAILLMTGNFLAPHDNGCGENTDEQVQQRINRALADLEAVKQQNKDLQLLLKELGKAADTQELKSKLKAVPHVLNIGKTVDKGEPSLEYEMTRRKLERGVREFWYYMSSQLKKIQKSTEARDPHIAKIIKDTIEEGAEHKRILQYDFLQLQDVDGYCLWREREAQDLSELIQLRLRKLQNPSDCAKARKLVCSVNKGCGYGCQLHHAVYCFIIAYGTDRTMILKSSGWRYNVRGWEDVFLPVSTTCLSKDGETVSPWPGTPETQVLELPIIDSLSPRPQFLPLAIPQDLSERLMRLHGEPIVWWVGQFLKYLLRPQLKTQALLDDAAKKMGFKKPIVGIHIRRTDKVGTEAAFHSLEEYMIHAEEYFKSLELREKVEKRRIYLASDDPKVIIEARTRYPDYEILGDSELAKTAALSTRYTISSLNGIIIDIHLLSLSDHLVCTFSSQVCRIAYEIMQQLYPDASDRFKSLDDVYYYGGQNAHNVVAVHAHQAKHPGEIDMNIGDVVGIAGNHWDGFSKGRNTRTKQVGLYPSFKVQDQINIVDFPITKKIETRENS